MTGHISTMITQSLSSQEYGTHQSWQCVVRTLTTHGRENDGEHTCAARRRGAELEYSLANVPLSIMNTINVKPRLDRDLMMNRRQKIIVLDS